MKCEEVESRLSLYVAGEVGPQDARERINAHLAVCEHCRSLADEWQASRELLRLHEPPEFDAAFFDSIRRDVLRKISEPRPSLLARILGQPFSQRTLTYAAAFSVVVCAVILSSHFLRREPAPRVEVVKNTDRAQVKDEKDVSQSPDHTGQTGATNDSPVSSPSQPKPQRRGRRTGDRLYEAVRSPRPAPRPETRDAEQVAMAPRVQESGAFPPVQEPPAETASAERKMLRIELQTSDPNIRIIWLTPQAADHASSNRQTDRR